MAAYTYQNQRATQDNIQQPRMSRTVAPRETQWDKTERVSLWTFPWHIYSSWHTWGLIPPEEKGEYHPYWRNCHYCSSPRDGILDFRSYTQRQSFEQTVKEEPQSLQYYLKKLRLLHTCCVLYKRQSLIPPYERSWSWQTRQRQYEEQEVGFRLSRIMRWAMLLHHFVTSIFSRQIETKDRVKTDQLASNATLRDMRVCKSDWHLQWRQHTASRKQTCL